jgi:serine/threonine protein phosphatase 1
MRVLAIGDIHGCITALETLARFVPIAPDDLVVTLGDYVNRGPDSRGVLDWLIARRKTARVVALLGNHEIMMLAARDGGEALDRFVGYGGDATLDSYAPPGRKGTLDDVPDEHWRFLEDGVCAWYETATHFFVHANAYPDIPLDEQPDYMLHWEKFNDPPPHESGKIMICGHTSQKSGEPRSIRHAVCIDTWAYGRGWLTCLDVESGVYHQANQLGETRRGRLAPAE